VPYTTKQIMKAKKLWAMFGPEAQDIIFADFLKEVTELSDPAKMQKDLMSIQLAKARQDSNTLLIEKALRESKNG